MGESILDHYDIFIFDCDGVLMDVNLLKCEAFGKAVGDYPKEVVEKFVEYCKDSFGISRYVKFKDFFSKFSKEQFDEEKYNTFLSKYADECCEIYSIADLTQGSEELLSKLSDKGKLLYVASGSDEVELNLAFRNRGLYSYFQGIYGSPKTKSECTSKILRRYANKKVVFIGDALSDMKTAIEHELDFIYMSKYTVQSPKLDKLCAVKSTSTISTLEDLI